ncbi:hypothetical protein U27_02478 [Candidatus Vecturithrix granuli]|uniref:Inositolphosphotransferase Aur1/Ipt1 domain-containing protein n=1 Tax=Vecturithrix granuli TaxID=1499967 RepID=A0A0S6WAV6_VECG1|nr:hypothetical protein U27_02478 [Candidatus Vecturithrix granuli]
MTRGCPWSYKLRLVGLYVLAFGVFYLYPNLFPLFEPVYLPLLAIDVNIPLVPWTFLIYVSDYVLILLVVILLKEREQFVSFARMAFGVLVGCGLFFLFFPTVYPLPPYPDVDNLMVAAVMKFIQIVDQPRNCFPSMHVALTSVSSWAMRSFGRKVHLIFWIWTFMIYVSTLTTKQHYALDIVGGMGVMLIMILLEKRLFRSIPHGC